jgi:hypothetical protein
MDLHQPLVPAGTPARDANVLAAKIYVEVVQNGSCQEPTFRIS